MKIFRLYEVDIDTEKKTGKKRDYPSLKHFYKYGIETYNRYNDSLLTPRASRKRKGVLYFLNELNNWEVVNPFELEKLLNKEY